MLITGVMVDVYVLSLALIGGFLCFSIKHGAGLKRMEIDGFITLGTRPSLVTSVTANYLQTLPHVEHTDPSPVENRVPTESL